MAGQVQVEITANDRTQQGVQSAQRNIQGMAGNAQQSLKSMAGAADAVATSLAALGANAALAQLVGGVNAGVEAFNRLRAAQQGVSTVADRMGQSLSEVNKLVQDLTDDGLMNQADAAAAVKNFLTINTTVEETRKVLMGAKDAAAFNRQEMFSVSEAVRRFSEGVKNGNSAVSDAAGVQKNLTTILKERGYAETDLQRVQSDAAVRQALLNGLMQEMALYQGDAAKLADELAGAQARQGAETEKLKASIGEALAPAVAMLNEEGTKWTRSLRLWTEVHPEVARTLTAVAGGLLGAAAAATTVAGAITVVTVAVRGLVAATGPIGWAILAVGALVGVVGGLVTAEKANAAQQAQNEDQVLRLTDQYKRYEQVVKSSTATEDEKRRAQEEMHRITQQIGELMPWLVSEWDKEGKALDLDTEKWQKNTDAIAENKRERQNKAMFEAAANEAAARDSLNSFLANRDADRKAYVTEKVKVFGPEVLLNEAKRTQMEAELAAEFDKKFAEEEAALRQALASAMADTDRLSKMAAAPDERGRGSYTSKTPATNMPTTGGGGGGGGGDADPYKAALRYMEHRKAIGRLSLEEELAELRVIQATYAKTDEQRMDAAERVYKAEQALGDKAEQDAEKRIQARIRVMDHLQRMNQATTKDEIATLQAILSEETAYFAEHEDQRMQMAERLAEAQKRHADEVAGAVADQMEAQAQAREASVKGDIDAINHRQRMGQLSREQEIAAIEQHLQTWAGYYKAHTDELWSLEERLYSLKEQARQEDLKREQEAERERVESVKTAQQDVLKVLASSEKHALQAMNDRHKLAESALQREIDLAETRLRQLDKEYAAQDRIKKLQDAQQKVDDLRAQQAAGKGDGEWVLGADGSKVWRVRGLAEAEKQLEEIKTETQRAEERERLQLRVENLRSQLATVRETHAQELAAHQTFWEQVRTKTAEGFAELEGLQGEKMGGLATALGNQLSGMLTQWQTYASQVRTILDGLGGAAPAPAAAAAPTSPPLGASLPTWAQGALSVAGSLMTNITAPMLPPMAAAAGNTTIGALQLSLPNVSNAQQFAQELPGALQKAGIDIKAVQRGIMAGRVQGVR